MKQSTLKRIAFTTAACAAIPLGVLLADDKDDKKLSGEAQRELAEKIQEELKKQLGGDADFLKELLKNAADGGGAFKLELDGDDAKKFLEGGGGDLAERMRELLEGAQRLDSDELQDELKGNPKTLRLELDPRKAGDGRMGDLMKFYQAQLANRKPGRNEKDHRSATEEYKPVVAEARKSTARVLDKGGKQVALATVVSEDGYLVSKASELPGRTVTCEFAGGRKLKAERVDSHEGWDLALLKVDADDLRPADFVSGGAGDLGTFLAASGAGEYPVAIGVVSVAPRNLSMAGRGFLGIGMENGEDGVRVREVQPNTAAAEAGLKIGDIIFEVEGKEVDAPAELAQAISGLKPKDEIHLKFRRGDKERKVTATLGSRQLNARRMQNLDRSRQMGGPLSESRGDFPNALQHDLTLLPQECGGPLVNLDGKVVGVNLARGGRVKSYAIPTADLNELLGDLKSGRFAMASAEPEKLERELGDSEKEISELERKLEQARARREAAMRALEEKKGK